MTKWGRVSAVALLVALGLPFRIFATETGKKVQMIFESPVTTGLNANLMATAYPAQGEEVQEAFEKATRHAKETFHQLNVYNHSGELTRLVNRKEKGTFDVSPDLAKILFTALEVAKKIREPMAKKIKVDLGRNRVTLKSTDVLINVEPVLIGYLADVIIEDLFQAGWKDLFLELGGVHVARGEDFNGPWKVPVLDNTTENAQRAFFYKVRDTSAVTIDWRSGGMDLPSFGLKSVTVFSKGSAAKAQGLASATYIMAVEDAKKFLKSSDVTRAVLIDKKGEFIQIPEERQ